VTVAVTQWEKTRKPAARLDVFRTSVTKEDTPPDYRAWLLSQYGRVELLGLRLKYGQSIRLNTVYVPPLPAKIGETLSPSEINVQGGEVQGP